MRDILIATLVGVLFFVASLVGFSMQHALLLGIVAFLVALWTNEALPLGVVSLLPIVLFPLFGILDTEAVAQNYSTSIIFLFLGGFMLAIAIEKIGLHQYFSAKLLNLFPKSARGIIYALAFCAALLSSILNNTTVTLMLMPIALYLSPNIKLKIRFLLATAYGASLGGILTPIGTAPNLFLLGFLQGKGIEIISFGEWVLLMAPVVGLMLLIVPYLLSLGVQKECVEEVSTSIPVLNLQQKRLYAIIIVLALLLIANTALKGLYDFALDEKLILLSFGLLMFLPRVGFLTWEDTRNLPYEIVFLFGAGFSIAAAFGSTGLASDIAVKLSFIGDMPLFWMLLFAAFFVSFSTEVTSNTALTSIVVPIFYEIGKGMGSEGIVLVLVATVAASYAFMLPIATPPNAIIMSSRLIPIKTMMQIGFKINLIGIVIVATVGFLFWRVII